MGGVSPKPVTPTSPSSCQAGVSPQPPVLRMPPPMEPSARPSAWMLDPANPMEVPALRKAFHLRRENCSFPLQTRKPSQTSKSRTFSRFFQLPPEIRTQILRYHLCPDLLQVQIRGELLWQNHKCVSTLQLQHIIETENAINVRRVSINGFIINKRLRLELMDLLFEYSIWDLGGMQHCRHVMDALPQSVARRIRRISISMQGGSYILTSVTTNPTLPGQMTSTFTGLRQLHVVVELETLANAIARPNRVHASHADSYTLAALCLSGYTWGQWETKLPLPLRDVPELFLEAPRKACRRDTIRYSRVGLRRYVGEVGEVSIKPIRSGLSDDDVKTTDKHTLSVIAAEVSRLDKVK